MIVCSSATSIPYYRDREKLHSAITTNVHSPDRIARALCTVTHCIEYVYPQRKHRYYTMKGVLHPAEEVISISCIPLSKVRSLVASQS